jgi:hypothetical protein
MDRIVEQAAAAASISLEQARAFLLAMREPSTKMEEAGNPIVDAAWQAGIGPAAPDNGPAVMVVPANPRGIYTAMIDAAVAD